MKTILAFVFAIGALAATADAAPENDAFAKAATANTYALNIAQDGNLTGPGADLIEREADKAQFFMVGEQHATAGIASINLALHRLVAKRGFEHAALEIGPYSTEEVERLVRSGQGHLASFVRQPGHSFVFPFLGFAEEAALVEQIVSTSRASPPVLWGIDQEFAGSAPLHIARLRTWARTPDQRTLLTELANKSAIDPYLIATADPSTYNKLRAAFSSEDEPAAARLIDDLVASSLIYAPFIGKGGPAQVANASREALLKQQFLAHFAKAEAAIGTPPKVFFKFGANHAMRGHSLSDVPAFGNFLAEWGLSRGFSMLNVAIDCIGGEQTDPRTGETSACETYFALPASSPLQPQPGTKGLVVFDLRPLRSLMPKNIDTATKRLVLAFDLYIPVRSPAPATLIGKPVETQQSR